jgi:hypothetical protein
MNRDDLLTLRLMISRSPAAADCRAYCERLRDEAASGRGPFRELIRFDLDHASRLLDEGRYEDALRHVQLIHNLPLTASDVPSWDRQHFYQVELASYLETETDLDLIERHIALIGQTCAAAGRGREAWN